MYIWQSMIQTKVSTTYLVCLLHCSREPVNQISRSTLIFCHCLLEQVHGHFLRLGFVTIGTIFPSFVSEQHTFMSASSCRPSLVFFATSSRSKSPAEINETFTRDVCVLVLLYNLITLCPCHQIVRPFCQTVVLFRCQALLLQSTYHRV
jgi:hypothetical protein